jgi:hypothetical protein
MKGGMSKSAWISRDFFVQQVLSILGSEQKPALTSQSFSSDPKQSRILDSTPDVGNGNPSICNVTPDYEG